MSGKWTKAQIETAKKYLEKGCDDVVCKECVLKDIVGCFTYDPTMYEDMRNRGRLFKSLLQQHEHDADEQDEQSNTLNDPKMEWANLPTNMSMHDYWRYHFAGMVIQGVISNSAKESGLSDEEIAKQYASILAQSSVMYADELLKQLEEKK